MLTITTNTITNIIPNNIPTELTMDTTTLPELYTEYDRLLTVYEDWATEPAATVRGLQVLRTRLAYLKHKITVLGGTL